MKNTIMQLGSQNGMQRSREFNCFHCFNDEPYSFGVSHPDFCVVGDKEGVNLKKLIINKMYAKRIVIKSPNLKMLI